MRKISAVVVGIFYVALWTDWKFGSQIWAGASSVETDSDFVAVVGVLLMIE